MDLQAAIGVGKSVGAAGIVLLSCWAAGLATFGCLPSARRALTRAELNVLALGVGAALVSQTVFFLGLAGLLYDATFTLLSLACLGAWVRWGRDAGAGAPTRPGSRAGTWIFGVVALPFAWLYLPNVLAPEIGADSVRYHLGLVFQYYRTHEIPAITSSIYAFLSQGMEMLYLFAFAFGRYDAPKLIHFGLFLATIALLVTLGRRFELPLAGWVAAALYALTSVVASDAATAYNDCALAFFLLAAFYGLAVWFEEGGREWAAVVGVLAGFAVAVKLTAAFAAAAVGLTVAWKDRRALVGFGLAAAFFALAWPARNAVVARNPAAPFLNETFPNPHVGIRWEQDYRNYLKLYRWPYERRGWMDYAELPLEAAVRGVRHGGVVGPILFALPLLIAAGYRRRWTPVLLAAAAPALAPYLSNSGTRFLIPALPFLYFAAALVVERLPRRFAAGAGALLVFAHAAFMWPGWMPSWRGEDSFWHLSEAPWPVVLGAEDVESYRGRFIDDYATVQALKVMVPSGSRVFAVHSVPEAFFPGEVITSHDGRLGEELAREMMMVLEPDFRPTRVTRFAFDAQPAAGVRLRQTASEDNSWWAVAEIELTTVDGMVVSPPRATRVEARDFPWTGDRLIDGDPWTVWRAWNRLRPSTITLEWDGAIGVAGLVVRAPWGQHFPQYAVEVLGPDGLWREVAFGLEIERLEDDVAALKARAHEALREEEIRAVVGRIGGGGQAMLLEAIEQGPASWGMEEAWRQGNERIYRVLDTRMR